MADQDFTSQINSVINSLKKKFIPTKQLMLSIAEEMNMSARMNILNQGKDVPGGWAPLKPATIRAKERKGFPDNMLQQTGMLLRSLQSSSTENTAIVSINKRYAAIHNFGGVINMAARTRTLFHRTDAKGNLLRQKSDERLLVFAKKNHKRKVAYTFGQKAYKIIIPKREFMVLTPQYKTNIIRLIRQHIISTM
jgi:phage virion morphogenesis protein